MMNNKELHALQSIFGLTTPECALHIAGHSTPRTWQKYLQGTVAIPNDVAAFMQKLAEARMQAIENIEDDIKHNDNYSLPYYFNEKEYFADHRNGSVIDFKMQQSVAAYFFAEGLVSLD